MREHARRAAILDCVAAVPGAHLRAVQRLVDMPLGTLRHHLSILLQQGRLAAESDRRFLRFYPIGMAPPTRRIWDAVRTGQSRRIVELLGAWPGLAPAELGGRLGLARSTVHVYVRRLRALGVVKEEGDGLRLRDPALALAVLESVGRRSRARMTDGAIDLFDQLER